MSGPTPLGARRRKKRAIRPPGAQTPVWLDQGVGAVLLQADWLLPISGPPIANGAVAVEGTVIVAVGPAEELRSRYPAEPVREFPGCALMPGLVNTHTHLKFSAFGGFAEPCGFGEWMLRLLLAARKLSDEDYGVSALWGAYECARSGVTSIADTCREGWTVARAAAAVGLRARGYLEVFGLDDAQLPAIMEGLEAGLERTRREAGAGAGGAPMSGAPGDGGEHGPAVEAGVSPHAPYSVSARVYRETARFARREGLRLATHVAESQAEVELLTRGKSAIATAYKTANLWTGQRWRPPHQRPLQYVAQTGALGPETLVVHAVELDDDDIAALAASEAVVAHCPRSNQRLQCGIAPVAEMMAAGVTVGLGTDSLASNDSLDMFAEMRAALAASRARAAFGARAGGRATVSASAEAAPTAPLALTPETVLRMATLDGARAVGWDRLVGSLEPGKLADIIAVQLPGRAFDARRADARALDPVSLLVATATADDVRMTTVEGNEIFGDCQSGVPADVVAAFKAARAKLGLP